MAEFTSVAVQTVQANNNVLFTETPICPSKCILHREGSGLVTLRGLTNQCKARFRVSFYGNVGNVPTPALTSIAIAVDGEALGEGTAQISPYNSSNFFNVSASVFVDVPRGCCETVSVKNINAQQIDVQNANLIVERVA